VPATPRVEPARGLDATSPTRRQSQPATTSDPYGPSPDSAVPGSSYGADSATASYSRRAHSGSYQLPEPAYGGNGGYDAAPGYQPSQPDGPGGPHGLPTADRYHSDPYSADPYSADPYSADPYGADSYQADPYRAGSYGADPYGADSYRTELDGGYRPAPGYDTTSPYQNPAYPASNGYEPAPYEPAAYGSSGYGSTSSHPLPASHNGYGSAGYQAPAYPSYGTSGRPSGSHRRPESGYPSENYGADADPAAESSLGYPVYPAPVPAAHNGYGSADSHLPGYGTATYQPGDRDQARYQPPAREANGYAGADPYAVDPYGQHSNGGRGH
jgi:hypothetical protein